MDWGVRVESGCEGERQHWAGGNWGRETGTWPSPPLPIPRNTFATGTWPSPPRGVEGVAGAGTAGGLGGGLEEAFSAAGDRLTSADKAELEPPESSEGPGAGRAGPGVEFWDRPASNDGVLPGANCGTQAAEAGSVPMRRGDGFGYSGHRRREARIWAGRGRGCRFGRSPNGEGERPAQWGCEHHPVQAAGLPPGGGPAGQEVFGGLREPDFEPAGRGAGTAAVGRGPGRSAGVGRHPGDGVCRRAEGV